MEHLECYKSDVKYFERAMELTKKNDYPENYEEFKAMFELLQESVAFDCSDVNLDFIIDSGSTLISEVENNPYVMPLRLPYPVCFLELRNPETGELGSLLLAEKYDSDGNLQIYIKPLDTYLWFFPEKGLKTYSLLRHDPEEGFVFQNIINDELVEPTTPYYVDYATLGGSMVEVGMQDYNGTLAHTLTTAMGFLKILKEDLIKDTTITNAFKFINTRRKKKGRSPLISEYHILRLSKSKISKRLDRFGKRSKQRLHWRRGHVKTLYRDTSKEKIIWVDAYLAGDEKLGFISKDYALDRNIQG